MYVVHHAHLLAPSSPNGSLPPPGGQPFPAAHAAGFQVWMHTLPPGGHTPVQRHGGELVGLALAGSGKLLVGGGPQRFQSPCTLLIPPDTEFQVANNGAVALQLVLVFTQAPVAVANNGC